MNIGRSDLNRTHLRRQHSAVTVSHPDRAANAPHVAMLRLLLDRMLLYALGVVKLPG
jgi:hypothetical protein